MNIWDFYQLNAIVMIIVISVMYTSHLYTYIYICVLCIIVMLESYAHYTIWLFFCIIIV